MLVLCTAFSDYSTRTSFQSIFVFNIPTEWSRHCLLWSVQDFLYISNFNSIVSRKFEEVVRIL